MVGKVALMGLLQRHGYGRNEVRTDAVRTSTPKLET
jgi:hypothetical protein